MTLTIIIFYNLNKTPLLEKNKNQTKEELLSDSPPASTLSTVSWDPATGLLATRTDKQKETVTHIGSRNKGNNLNQDTILL